jgi:hypothetical protein
MVQSKTGATAPNKPPTTGKTKGKKMSDNINPGVMTDEEILEAYAGKSTRGVYELRLVEFAAMDEAGIEPSKQWPLDFSDKTASALVQSFRNAIAKNELEGQIELVQREGRVFLFSTERIRILKERKAAEAAASNGNAAQ